MDSNRIALSVVIPVYNVERYISECLESIYHQDINDFQFEVICVDDGCTDNTMSIIVGFQNEHKNLQVLHHSNNLGLGTARNTGLSVAKGEYVWFVDADDFIREKCFSFIIGQCEQNNLDILHWSVLDNTGRTLFLVEDIGIVSGVEDVVEGNGAWCFAWDRVYKRSFLFDNNLWFSTKRNSDVLHTLSALNRARRVKGSVSGYYYYRKERVGSAMSSLTLDAARIYDYSFVMGRELHRLSHEFNSELADVAHKHAVWQSNTAARMAIKLPFREKKAFCRMIDKDLKNDIWSLLYVKNRILLSFPQLLYLFHIPYLIFHFVRHVKDDSMNNEV